MGQNEEELDGLGKRVTHPFLCAECEGPTGSVDGV